MTAAIPVTLIGGYLGAGKTTLVNSLLRNAAGRRLAVLVNDFGALPIDADLIEAQGDNLISISGGCICCSFGSDLVTALIDVQARGEQIDHLLIETSGVALPGTIVQSLTLVPGLAIDAVVVVADAETIRERAHDKYMSDTILGQLAAADLIVLNKSDLVTQDGLNDVSNWLTEAAPGARVLTARNADVPHDVILGTNQKEKPHQARMAPMRHLTQNYKTISLEVGGFGHPEEIVRTLAEPRMGVLRAKGFLARRDGTFVAFHIVGCRVSLEPAPAWIKPPGRLVCIGLAAKMDGPAIVAAVHAYAAKSTRAAAHIVR